MTAENPKKEEPDVTASSDVVGELRELGRNLAGILQSAWESEERKRLQEEIRVGLADLGTTLNEAAEDFRESPTGQRLRADVDDFRERVRRGEVESKVRSEILSVLRTVNTELEKARRKTTGPGEGGKGE